MMIMHKLLPFCIFAIASLFVQGASAQQPTPPLMVVQAATATKPAVTTPVKSVATDGTGSLQAALKALQQAKAANAETLKRQEATLQQLDDLQKAAEQLKIFAKRG
jgi:hypothetical protein